MRAQADSSKPTLPIIRLRSKSVERAILRKLRRIEALAGKNPSGTDDEKE